MKWIAFVLVLCAIAQDRPSSQNGPGPASVRLGSLLTWVDSDIRRNEPVDGSTGVTFRERLISILRSELHCTRQEIEVIGEVAALYRRRGKVILASYSDHVFKARLEVAENGSESEATRQAIGKIDAQHAENLSQAMQELKSGLGAERLQELDAWVPSPEAAVASHCRVGTCGLARR